MLYVQLVYVLCLILSNSGHVWRTLYFKLASFSKQRDTTMHVVLSACTCPLLNSVKLRASVMCIVLQVSIHALPHSLSNWAIWCKLYVQLVHVLRLIFSGNRHYYVLCASGVYVPSWSCNFTFFITFWIFCQINVVGYSTRNLNINKLVWAN